MLENERIHTKYNRGVFEVEIDRKGVIEKKDSCIMNVDLGELRQGAIVTTIWCTLMIIVALVLLVPEIKSEVQKGTNSYTILFVTLFLALWCIALLIMIRSSWRELDTPHPPLIITKQGITLPNQQELPWDDIEIAYFTVKYYRHIAPNLYILMKNKNRIKIKDWSLYAIENQWKKVLNKYSHRQIVDNTHRKF